MTRSWCISSCKFNQQTSCDADLQLSHCHGQLLYNPNFAEALERNVSSFNRNGDSKYGKNELRKTWIIRCGY